MGCERPGPLWRRCTQRRGAPGPWVTQRGAAGTRRDVPWPAGALRRAKMSVAGLKKQFHKASQVRERLRAAAEPCREIGRWWVARPEPAAARLLQGAADTSIFFATVVTSASLPGTAGNVVSSFTSGFSRLSLPLSRICRSLQEGSPLSFAWGVRSFF